MADQYNTVSVSYANGAANGWMRVIYFNLSGSSSVYSTNASVQPSSTKCTFLIRY